MEWASWSDFWNMGGYGLQVTGNAVQKREITGQILIEIFPSQGKTFEARVYHGNFAGNAGKNSFEDFRAKPDVRSWGMR